MAWAAKMRAARHDETCRLMLVGDAAQGLDDVTDLGGVIIEKSSQPHALAACRRASAFPLSQRARYGRRDGRATRDDRHAIISKLLHNATGPEYISRDAFVGLLRQWINSAPEWEAHRHVPLFNIHRYAPAELLGREEETRRFWNAWNQALAGEAKRPHILTFVALGGEGKTSLVAKWAAELARQDWPGCEAAFAWSFYSQGTREQAGGLVRHVSQGSPHLLRRRGDGGQRAGAFDKGRRLAQLVGERRALLILDGLEPLQYAPTSPTPGELKDQGLAALLKGWPPPATACASSPPGIRCRTCATSGRPPRRR